MNGIDTNMLFALLGEAQVSQRFLFEQNQQLQQQVSELQKQIEDLKQSTKDIKDTDVKSEAA